MKVKDVMTKSVHVCSSDEPLSKAAAIMWEHDCGCVPVVDQAHKVIGMVTDRDICMSTWMNGRPAHELSASVPMSKQVFTCKATDHIDVAEKMMREKQVRRLPVVDDKQKLVGILSLNDIVRRTEPSKSGKAAAAVTDNDVRRILEGVSSPRS